MVHEELKILFLSPEVVPFAKTGGLADVAGSLPSALKRIGTDVRLVLPYYRMVREGSFEIRPISKTLNIPLGNRKLMANVFETRLEEEVPVYLIEREDLYDRPNLYGSAMGDYYDNLERFSFFSHGALHIAQALSFRPDLIHCHDWQTGLVPAILKGPYRDSSFFAGTPSVFTIHNLGYPGLFSPERLPATGLPTDPFFHPEGLEYYGMISLLKAGIIYSEAITTVSPNYAREIQTPEFGLGMEGILQHRKAFLHGILNGVDYRIWDPEKDSQLAANYTLGEMAGKKRCKDALIQEMGLEESLKNRPLMGMISRLDAQKGLELFVEILDDILALEVGLVVLGSGDENIQQAIQEAANGHPGHVGIKFGFDEPLAHRIMAGVDIFLIPSKYEPCGLTQMYALKYGTVPVVRATGGLEDTITAFDLKTGRGNGFKFGPYRPQAFLAALREAVELFQDSRGWTKLMGNGMKADFSWERSARQYVELYRSLIGK